MGKHITAALLVICLGSVAGAEEEEEGVRVYAEADRVTFELMENPKWSETELASEETGFGCGIGFRKDGWIVTTSHQLDDVKSVGVVCPDGVMRRADRWLSFDDIDMGLVHVPDYEVPVPRFGETSTLRPGSTAYVMGAPNYFKRSLTKGIISGLHRSVIVDGKLTHPFQSYIQTDAQANPGNSGGPLLNAKGEVTGLVVGSLSVLKSARPAVSFALPIDVVRVMGARLLAEERAFRAGWLDTEFATWGDKPLSFRAKIGFRGRHGVILFGVSAHAAKAGLRDHDVVVRVGEVEMKSWAQLRVQLAMGKPGDEVELGIVRAGKPLVIKVKLLSWRDPRNEDR